MTEPVAVRRVGIAAKARAGAISAALIALSTWLQQRGLSVAADRETASLVGNDSGVTVMARESLPGAVDLLVVVGGDGTLLNVVGHVARSPADPLLLGINSRGGGFLTPGRLDDACATIEAVLGGNGTFQRRALLEAEHRRGPTITGVRAVLNEVAFTRAAHARMVELTVSVDGAPLSDVKADGLIVATASGSTAYNLAAGGPVVHPGLDALVVTPVAPHALTSRSIVTPAGLAIDVGLAPGNRSRSVVVTYDGQTGHALGDDETVRLRLTKRRVTLVVPSGRTYFDTLREMLGWQLR